MTRPHPNPPQSEEGLRQFHLGDILSASHDLLVSPRLIGGVYDILNYITGDNLFTHQLPRAIRECEPYLRLQLPWLNEISADGVGPDNWKQWLDAAVSKYGEMHTVEPLPHDGHERIDPLSEAVEMMHPSKIIVVSP